MSNNSPLSSEQRQSLQTEYQIAFQMFQLQNSQAWQTFSIASTIALAGLAFVGQLKTVSNNNLTWPITLTVGVAMIIILIGWLVLANRWWSFAQVSVFRLMEIENQLGLYLFRQGTWIRNPLDKKELEKLDNNEIRHYEILHKNFPKFPSLKQQTVSSIIAIALILIWIFFIFADIFALI